jgi:hypothetical protein
VFNKQRVDFSSTLHVVQLKVLILTGTDKFSAIINFWTVRTNPLFLFIYDRYGQIICSYSFLPVRTNSLLLLIFERYGQILCSYSFMTGKDKFFVLIQFWPVRSNSLLLFIYDRYGQILCYYSILTATDKFTVLVPARSVRSTVIHHEYLNKRDSW